MFILVAVVFLIISISRHNSPPERSNNPAPEAICPGYALRVGLPPLNETISKVPVIVVASLEQSTRDHALFKVQKVLKGNYLLKNDIIKVCPGFSTASEEENFDSTLLLLNGMEKDSKRWAPEQAEFGVIPARNKDGRFLIRSIHEEGTYYSAKDIQRAVEKSSQ